MILRVLVLASGMTGAAAVSQFPEFSQQYVQRLGGAVDALGQVVADFDASAAAEGLTRADALAQMTGTAFVDRRRQDMARTIDRHARLLSDVQTLRRTGPFMRAYHVARLDGEIARATWQDFKPALPLTFAGAVFAGVGFLAGCLVAGLASALLRWVSGRRRTPA